MNPIVALLMLLLKKKYYDVQTKKIPIGNIYSISFANLYLYYFEIEAHNK